MHSSIVILNKLIMVEMQFEEIDEVGHGALDVISDADRFNTWMYETIAKHASGRTLEIGSGIGNISKYFFRDKRDLMVTDIREGYCARLQRRFSKESSYQGTVKMNLTDEDFDTRFKEHFEQFDTVFALNVVEHIYDDRLAIENAKKLLKPKGRLIILVPAYQLLFNGFDKELGHYRRYTQPHLSGIFEEKGFTVIHKQYFNFMGIFGWFLSGRIMGNTEIPEAQMGLYNRLVPVFRVIDRLTFRSMGLSTIVVGEKP